MDQKITPDRYQLVPRVLIFITRGEEVLLLKGAPTKRLWANLYNGIGGHVERGEHFLAAAHRELLEETGLPADRLAPPGLWLCGLLSVDTGGPTGVGVAIFRGVLAHPGAPGAASPTSTAIPDTALTPSTFNDYAQPTPPPADNIGYAQIAASPEGSLEWVHPAMLPSLPCLPDLPDLLPRCLAHTPTDPPFFALSTPGAGGKPVIVFA